MEGEGEDQKYSLPACQDLLTTAHNAFLGSSMGMGLDWSSDDIKSLRPVMPTVYEDDRGVIKNVSIYDFNSDAVSDEAPLIVSVLNPLEYAPSYRHYPADSTVFIKDRQKFNDFMRNLSDEKRARLGIQDVTIALSIKRAPSYHYSWTLLADNKIYYFAASDQWDTSLRQLKDDGKPEKICSVKLYPGGEDNADHHTERQIRRLKNYIGSSDAATYPNAQAIYLILSDIMGNALSYAGSMCTWCERLEYNEKVALRAAFRPWGLANQEGPSYFDRTYSEKMAFLQLWSTGGPWQRQRFERLQQEIPTAIENFSRYYQSYFGYSGKDAGTLASAAVDAIVRVFFSGATTYDEKWPVDRIRQRILQFMANPGNQESVAKCGGYYLGFLLLSDTPWSDMEPLLSPAIIGNPPGENIWKCRLDINPSNFVHVGKQEPLLSYALHRPDDMVRLIEQGTNLEERNRFGKTTLMFAAHLDNLPAARILVEKGADVNATTLPQRPEDGYELQIQFWSRSALMYAAENASLKMISYLLKAGADATAQDSGGRGMLDYLGRNEGLSEKDKSKAAKMLQQAGAVN
jgi:hypothetical protein